MAFFKKKFRVAPFNVYVDVDAIHLTQVFADEILLLEKKLEEQGVDLAGPAVALASDCLNIAAEIMREIKYELHRVWNEKAMAKAGITGREGC